MPEDLLKHLLNQYKNKVDPYLTPLFDALSDMIPQDKLKIYLDSSVIEVAPLAYMRGRTFKRAFIIADEMQNATRNQMKMLLTRIGDNSRMVVTGDLDQSDRYHDNGLYEFQDLLEKYNECRHIDMVHFNKTDIRRHVVVEEVLRIYGDD